MYMTRKEIFDHIWTRTVQGFAEDYDLSYPKLLKVIKERNIPKPERRDLLYIKQGDAGLRMVHRPKLPGNPKEEVELPRKKKPEEIAQKKERRRRAVKNKPVQTYTVTIDFENHPRWSSLQFLAPAERKRVIRETETIKAVRSEKLHPVAAALKEKLDAWNAQVSIIGNEFFVEQEAGKPELLELVSSEQAERVITLLDSLYNSLEFLGGMVMEDGTLFLHGEEVPLKFTETRARVLREDTVLDEVRGDGRKGTKWTYQFSGKLTLSISHLYTLRDRKNEPLEERLGEALELIFMAAYQTARTRTDRREGLEETESFSREMEQTESLLSLARDYRDACEIRALILAVQKKLPGDDPAKQQRFPDWAAWASEKADWLDPTIGLEDPILGRRHVPILNSPVEET
ncbi:MAG: hypothetical protein IJ720_03700 [Clostridia bacterium]|nr:hypothetical protein [Clostridia bacterium]